MGQVTKIYVSTENGMRRFDSDVKVPREKEKKARDPQAFGNVYIHRKIKRYIFIIFIIPLKHIKFDASSISTRVKVQ